MKSKTGKYVVAGLFAILVLISGCTQQEKAPPGVPDAGENKSEISPPDINPAETKEQNQTVTQPRHLFSWDDVPGRDSDQLINYLEGDLKMGWVKNAKIMKSGDGKTITLIHPGDTASIKIDKKSFGCDFATGNGTYLFKIHSPLFSNQDDSIVGVVIDVKLPNGTEVQVAAKTDMRAVVENVEIYVSNVTMVGDIPATADVTAEVKLYDTQGKNSLVFKLNAEESNVILEIGSEPVYEYILKKENGKMNVYDQNTKLKFK